MKWIKQQDAMQCGVASLAMICSYYGKDIGINSLEEICQPTMLGMPLLGLRDAAIELGFDAKPVKIGIEYLLGLTEPIILHWNQNHFVVLYRVNKKGTCFYISDPAKGIYRCSREEFEKKWISILSDGARKGIGLLLHPTEKFKQIKVTKPTEDKSFFVLLQYVKKYRRYFLQITVGLVVGCILQLILPFLTQGIVDLGIKHNDISLIWLILLGEFIIIISRAATSIIRNRLILHISMRINISLVSDFFIKLLKLPMSFFDTKQTGDLLQRISDHQRIQTFLTTQIISTLFTILCIVVFGIVLLIYNYLIFSVFIIFSIIYCIWMMLFMKRRKIIDYELFECQAINQNKTFQFITSMQEIKLQDCETRRRWEWEDVQAVLFHVQMKALNLQQTQETGALLLNELKNIFITVLSATAVIQGQISLGAMLAIQYIVGQLNSPLDQLMSFLYAIQDVRISLERINDIHKRKEEDKEGTDSNYYESNRNIILNKVKFRYNKHDSNLTIKDVNISIPEGKVTAIVGASGCGKTTLIKLILGYYMPDEGEIKISGKPLAEYNLKWWRRQCGVVLQDGIIFSESIMRNIAVDDNEVDLSKLEWASRLANIHDFVSSLPMGYNTMIGREGMGLSQGQKQRILIARAAYKQPQFIFLDEATNALDAKNERIIVNNLAEFYKGRTVVVVAHRLSTVKNADNIIVLDNGVVAEQGTNDDLIKIRGVYYNLIKNQLELGN